MVKYIAGIIFLAFITSGAGAQEVSFEASGPGAVKAGERFAVTYKANAKPSRFVQPGFPSSFNVLAGPSTSSSSSVQVINGKVTRNHSYAYTYYLQATQSGNFEIKPAAILVKGREFQSNTLQVEVVGGGSAPRPKKQSSPAGPSPASSAASGVNSEGENLFIRVLTDKNSVYQGEVLIANVKIFSKVNLSGIQNAKQPSFQGFLKEDIETPDLRSLHRENVNGEIYGTGIIQRFALFPQHSGEIVIEPYELDCIYQKKVSGNSRSIFDDFFGNYQNVKSTIKSKPVRIQVKPLPPGKPAGFTGGVGNFKFSASLDQNTVKANEGITLKLGISGNGNIKIVDRPEISFPPDFEVYDPEININANASINGVSGAKSFEYLIIPRHPGNYRIPPIAFSYFNPATGRYHTTRSPEFNIEVRPGETDEGAAVISGLSKEDVKFLGKDIRYLKTGTVTFREKGSYLVNRLGFHLIYLACFVLFVLIIVFMRRQIRQNADINRVKNKRASKFAKKRLKKAALYLKQNNKQGFYDETLKAIWGYLSDKLSIPISALSKEKTRITLEDRNVSGELTDELFDILNNCEFARYAPGSDEGEMEKLYERAEKLIGRLQGQIK